MFGLGLNLNDYPDREYTQVSGNVQYPETGNDIVWPIQKYIDARNGAGSN